MQKNTTGKGKPKKAEREQHPQIFYRIHALLHTVRAIGSYEDQLCTLMNDIKSSGQVNEIACRELQLLLEEIPSSEYQDDLDAVRRDLGSDVSSEHPWSKRPDEIERPKARAKAQTYPRALSGA